MGKSDWRGFKYEVSNIVYETQIIYYNGVFSHGNHNLRMRNVPIIYLIRHGTKT